MAISDETQSNPTVRTPAYLGSSLQIKGQVTGDEDLKIDGKVEGPISLGDYRTHRRAERSGQRKVGRSRNRDLWRG